VKKPGLWHCLERLQHEENPQLFAMIERKDADQLLKMRASLRALVNSGITKGRIASAKKLLAQK
jgi:hypothetical protein